MARAKAGGWQPWAMRRLERRGPEHVPPAAAALARRREDQIGLTLFDLAKEDAEKKGYEAGHAEGFARGYAEGEDKIRAEMAQRLSDELAARLAPIDALATGFRRAVDGLQENLAYRLVDLAIETGRALAGRALELKPEHILDDIEDLMEEHPGLTGAPALYVNIDDLTLVQTQLKPTLDAAGWQLRADMNLERGDCRIETETREIDASHADRWARLLHAVGHGEH